MEIVVHGTKGGYRILFKTPGAPSIGSDIRNNVSSEAAVGKSAFSIAFAANGCVFTKYIIIRDALRSDATGFIAFSLFLLFNEELPNKGAEVKSILDELSKHYVENYVRNNSINKGETNIIQEEWSFINNISGRKTDENKNRNNIEIQAGTKEAAFVFYKDDSELQDYFSKPFQEEYNGYKQILLISDELQNSSADLLNVLRNSGVEIKVDLNNEPFFLNEYYPNTGVTITANGRPRSNGRNNNRIRAKEKVELKYVKKYFNPIEVTGTLSNHGSDIFKYLEIKGNQVIIKYDELSSNLKPIEKTIAIYVEKKNSDQPVEDAEITCNNEYGKKDILKNVVTFRDIEIGQRWTISAKKGNDLMSSDKIIIPENENRVELVLNEHKKIKFQGEFKTEHDTKYFPDIKISIRKKNIHKSSNKEVEFINDEIKDQFEVIAIYSENNTYLHGIKMFCPKDIEDVKPVSIELKQQTSQKAPLIYLVDTGKYGSPSAGYSYFADGRDVIVTNKTRGNIFREFKLDETKKKGNYEGTLVAQYDKPPYYKNPMYINGLIVVAILIVFGILAYYTFPGNDQPEQPQQPTVQHIKAYIEGNSLILDTLNSYKNIPNIEQKEVLDSLVSAIKKREFINSWNFDELKKLHYYTAQQNFDTTIKKINSPHYDAVKSRFGDISSWTLDKIADSINYVLNDSKQTEENDSEMGKQQEENQRQDEEMERQRKKREEEKKKLEQLKKVQEVDESKDSPPASSNNAKDIPKKLQSNTVTRDELQSWKNAGMDKNKRSIELYLKFWSIVNSGQKDDFDKLLKDAKSDAILKNSELKNFLTSICTSSDAFQKYNNASGKATCKTIAELKNKVK